MKEKIWTKLDGNIYKDSYSSDNNMPPGNPQGLPDESFISKKTLVFIDTPFSRSNDLIKNVYKYILLKKEDFDNAPLNNKKEKKGK